MPQRTVAAVIVVIGGALLFGSLFAQWYDPGTSGAKAAASPISRARRSPATMRAIRLALDEALRKIDDVLNGPQR